MSAAIEKIFKNENKRGTDRLRQWMHTGKVFPGSTGAGGPAEGSWLAGAGGVGSDLSGERQLQAGVKAELKALGQEFQMETPWANQ